MPQNDIRLACFFGSDDADLLPHFLAHYRSLDVTRFHFVLHGTFADRHLEFLAGQDDISVEAHVDEPYSDPLQCRHIDRLFADLDGKWVFHVDADELVELPYANTGKTIAALELFGADALPGYMLQRVSDDGSLCAIEASDNIWDTYPKADFNLTEHIGLDSAIWKSKFPLIKVSAKTKRKRGNHLPPNDFPAERTPMRAVIHHFKWRAPLLGNLKRVRGPESAESEQVQYRAWLEGNDNRLPTTWARTFSRADLFEIGLLARADRRTMAVYSLLGKIRKSRGKAGYPEAKLKNKARLLMEGAPTDETRPALPDEAIWSDLFGKTGRICLVSFELVGPTKTGGIGTAISALAELLSAFGHDVHVLFTPHVGYGELHQLWHDMWNARGVTLHYLPHRLSHSEREPDRHSICARIAGYLSEHSFDVIHFHENGGFGAHVARLCMSGVGFRNTRVCISTHGPQGWAMLGNGFDWYQSEGDITDVETAALRSADLVMSPSRYMLEWIEAQMTPMRRTRVMRNALPGSSRYFRRDPGGHRTVDEIVFFGRMEPRKGLDRFLDALELLQAGKPAPFRLTFLGREVDAAYTRRIAEHCGRLGLGHEIISNLGTIDAVNYLRASRCVVVVPSKLDNLPYTVYECLENGIPLVTTSVGGIPEMVPESHREQVLAADSARSLADRLGEVLSEGARTCGLSFDTALVELENIAVHTRLVSEAGTPRSQAVADHNVSIVVYGDGRSPAAHRVGTQLTSLPDRRFGRLFMTKHAGPARGEGEAQAPGGWTIADPQDWTDREDDDRVASLFANAADDDIVVFLHDRVQPDEGAIESLLTAAANSRADAMVCGYRFALCAPGDQAPVRISAPVLPMSLPLCSAAGQNLFGTGFFAVRGKNLNAMPFTNFDHGDRELFHWKLLNRLAAKGAYIEAIPASLCLRYVEEDEDWVGRVTRADLEDLLLPWTENVDPRVRHALRISAEIQASRTSDVDHLQNFLAGTDRRSITDEDGWIQAARRNDWLTDMFREGYVGEMEFLSNTLKNTRLGKAVRNSDRLKNGIAKILSFVAR